MLTIEERVNLLKSTTDRMEAVKTIGLFLAELECRAGEWGRADEYAEAILQSAEQQGLEFQGGSALWIRGLVDAYLGRLIRKKLIGGNRNPLQRIKRAWLAKYFRQQFTKQQP